MAGKVCIYVGAVMFEIITKLPWEGASVKIHNNNKKVIVILMIFEKHESSNE